jgi:hypothetical protein
MLAARLQRPLATCARPLGNPLATCVRPLGMVAPVRGLARSTPVCPTTSAVVGRSLQRGLKSTAAAAATAAAATEGVASTSFGGRLLQFARSQPYKTNIIIATFKTALCDVLVQRYIEQREHIDWQRNAVFAAFGFAYLGCVQWFIYVDCFKRLFPGMAVFAGQSLREKLANPAGRRALAGQVALDNFVHYTFIYFPIFYMFKESIQGDGHGGMLATVPSALAKYRDNCVEDNLKM